MTINYSWKLFLGKFHQQSHVSLVFIYLVSKLKQARAEEEESTTIASFPELTVAQRKFGVNPAFKSYFDPSFKREEGIGELEEKFCYSVTLQVSDDILLTSI